MVSLKHQDFERDSVHFPGFFSSKSLGNRSLRQLEQIGDAFYKAPTLPTFHEISKISEEPIQIKEIPLSGFPAPNPIGNPIR